MSDEEFQYYFDMMWKFYTSFDGYNTEDLAYEYFDIYDVMRKRANRVLAIGDWVILPGDIAKMILLEQAINEHCLHEKR